MTARETSDACCIQSPEPAIVWLLRADTWRSEVSLPPMPEPSWSYTDIPITLAIFSSVSNCLAQGVRVYHITMTPAWCHKKIRTGLSCVN
ncbi:hypothetical protein ElyMa_002041000 [Elysia marginata]|uniref:Uncharacterized protein n=1 Tax=Elysia marginata TaxID=1093978 RepID=A0AAV4F7C2_9GAST|nr:hypothetical protein ElyMa_002041000 [Elysia marginata]